MAVVYELKTIAIQLCVTRLMELGLEEEGLFRLSAGQAKVDMSKLSNSLLIINYFNSLCHRKQKFCL